MPFINKVIKDARPTLIEAEKANELIGYINGLLSSRGDDPIEVTIDDNGQMVISLSEESGIPEGFEEETFGVVEDDNTAGQRIFFAKPVSEE
jgi:hypothetical protein